MITFPIGAQEHLDSDGVSGEVGLIRRHGGTGIISDRAAATIASWWQAPSNPALTALSTAGVVDGDAIIREIDGERASGFDAACLLQLRRWVYVSCGFRSARSNEAFQGQTQS